MIAVTESGRESEASFERDIVHAQEMLASVGDNRSRRLVWEGKVAAAEHDASEYRRLIEETTQHILEAAPGLDAFDAQTIAETLRNVHGYRR